MLPQLKIREVIRLRWRGLAGLLIGSLSGHLRAGSRGWHSILTLTTISILGVGCSITTRQSSLDPKGPVAESQLDLFLITVYVTLFIFITVGGTLLWVVIRYREKARERDKPMLLHQQHGGSWIEIGLIAGAIALLVIIAVPTVKTIWVLDTEPHDPNSQLGNWYTGPLDPDQKEEILTLNVTAYQWWWTFEYPQFDVITANECALPVGKKVKINLRAADVIHSFWLPKLAGKMDLIPGRANKMWLQADEEGHYYGQCAEFCGEAHAYMLFRADALSEQAFVDWITHQKKDAPEPLTEEEGQAGKKLFLTKTCVQCHSIRGFTAGVGGPDLTHVASRKSLGAGILDNRDAQGHIDPQKQYENLFNWIQASHKYKPGNLMYYPENGLKNVVLSKDEVHKITTYLQTLQ